MRTGFQTICPERMFLCDPYAHCHCASCNKVLFAVGGGGDDGRGVGGYEDEHGNGARACAQCGDDSLLCKSCEEQNPLCPFCENQAFTLAPCDPKTCVECLAGAA